MNYFTEFKLALRLSGQLKKRSSSYSASKIKIHIHRVKSTRASVHVVKITSARQCEISKRGGMSTKTYEKTPNPQNIYVFSQEHKFNWKIIMNAPTNIRARKNLEAALISLKIPSLNDQMDSNQLILFRHDVT